jgi:hypothetical protein
VKTVSHFLVMFFAAFILLIGVSSKADASLIKWQLNATFKNQGSVTPTAIGTFVVDDSDWSLRDVNISTTSYWDTSGDTGFGNYPSNNYSHGRLTKRDIYIDGSILGSIPMLWFGDDFVYYPHLEIHLSHPLSDLSPVELYSGPYAYQDLFPQEHYQGLYGPAARFFSTFDLRIAPVPEPSTMLLVGLGLFGLVFFSRLKQPV